MLDRKLFTAFVLAGGASSRMGEDKARLELAGKPLIEHALDIFRRAGLTPSIVGTREDLRQYASVVTDLRAGCGPLSGLEAALQSCTTPHACFLPVDLPLLPPALLAQMCGRVSLTAALVTVPRFLGHDQPLCTVLDRRLLPAISRALDEGDYKVMRVLEQAALAQAGPHGIDKYDVEVAFTAQGLDAALQRPLHFSFFNCNAPADIRFLRQQIA